MQESKALHYILGTSLLMIAVFAVSAFVMVNSQAVDPQAQLGVNNVNPTVATRFLSTSANAGTDGFGGGTVDLIPGGTRIVYLNGLVADNNGEADISDVDVVAHRSGVSGGGASCAQDSNDCYRIDNCPLNTGAGTGLQVGYNCDIILDYYADSTSTGGAFPGENWVFAVVVNDRTGGSGNDVSLTKEMETRTALIIGGNINFGSLALGTNTTAANNVAFNIPQGGNDVADVEVSMSAASVQCITSAANTGVIPRANYIWSLTDVDYNGSGATALTGSAVDTNLAVGYRTGAAVSKDLFWNIQVPATGVGGTCNGPVQISVIAA